MRKGGMEERRERGRDDYEGRKERQRAVKRDSCHWYIGKKFTSSNLFHGRSLLFTVPSSAEDTAYGIGLSIIVHFSLC